jgi:hypothetical protein
MIEGKAYSLIEDIRKRIEKKYENRPMCRLSPNKRYHKKKRIDKKIQKRTGVWQYLRAAELEISKTMRSEEFKKEEEEMFNGLMMYGTGVMEIR